MMKAFYNGVSGVKSSSFGIDLSAHNISNVNTTGFKYSNAEFKDIFYSKVSSQSTNPAQSGYGSTPSASKLVFSQGPISASEGEFDVALQGKGFFGVLAPDGNTYYTRNGAFRRDGSSRLVDSYGNFVLGTMNPAFSAIAYSQRVSGLMGQYLNTGAPVSSGFTINSSENFNRAASGAQSVLSVPVNMYIPPQTTQNINWYGNLNSDTKLQTVKVELDTNEITLTKTADNKYIASGKVGKDEVISAKAGDIIILNFADDFGSRTSFETLLDENLNFTSNALDIKGLDLNSLKLVSAQIATEQEKSNQDILESPVYNADGSRSFVRVVVERILPQVNDDIEYKANAQIYNSDNEPLGEEVQGTLKFDKNGALRESTLTTINNPNGGAIALNFGTPFNPEQVGSGYSGVYVQPGKEKSVSYRQDGLAEGFFNKYQISDRGDIVAQFSNGKTHIIGKLALYNFINEEGLFAMGDNVFAATQKSGEASFILSNGEVVDTAKFKGGNLELSNVDLSNELTQLIVTQKAFDASSKSITTSDQMIQRAINMKK
ncbi:flagellar hook-basal body complex protein [Campylobacter sp. MIT 21-1685]|uniref:flagellar hook-basal body complex protein n=1 Tax=unclassified Campylobacter TaxID=2593542 RepID=UPI00224AE636|nr:MULTISPECIES: flagellar hook-basal body complex protein [unclassified Campylobacter]MCX2682652.1 flagellar hook-basal body complex protein [Campylobacter sp. MIT 21-1684]MCX2750932.1 flagellar hook-basal body complex protein [Campylobacter sp. MIT 21-1682]MCX2807135.1 flagellar hook-basal body complex protein [Campylobacter sp. MIT 21-1685]